MVGSRQPLADGLRIEQVMELAGLKGGTDPRWVDVPNTVATGMELFRRPFGELLEGSPREAHFGVDLLQLPAGGSFPLHTHPGHHLLYVVRGEGTVTFNGVTYATYPGDLYCVDAEVEHAVGAVDAHFLLSFGAPHKQVDDPARMNITGE